MQITYAARRVARRLLEQRGAAYGPGELERPAVVVAPHFDDETLGCGGLIALKRRAGARVRVIFMSDGSMSHARHMDGRRLAEIRAGEGLAACAALGVAADDVLMLNLPETRLDQHLETATARLAELLAEARPTELFVPYWRDPPPDHRATTVAALAAARQARLEIIIYEYPIWYWEHWPWVRPPVSNLRQGLRAARRSLLSLAMGLGQLRCHVEIATALADKQAALARHRSQTQRLISDADWRTLADVAGGDFLDCLLQEREWFYRHKL